MAEEVKPDTFEPPHHNLKPSIEAKLEALLEEYASQFAKDETSIGTTSLTEMMIDKELLSQYHKNPTQSLWNTINGWRMK